MGWGRKQRGPRRLWVPRTRFVPSPCAHPALCQPVPVASGSVLERVPPKSVRALRAALPTRHWLLHETSPQANAQDGAAGAPRLRHFQPQFLQIFTQTAPEMRPSAARHPASPQHLRAAACAGANSLFFFFKAVFFPPLQRRPCVLKGKSVKFSDRRGKGRGDAGGGRNVRAAAAGIPARGFIAFLL